MASLRFTDVQARLSAFLNVTGVMLREFPQFVPPFESAFHAHLAAWRLDGKPRLTRRCTVACVAWARPQPIHGCTSCSPCCWWSCVPSAMLPPVP